MYVAFLDESAPRNFDHAIRRADRDFFFICSFIIDVRSTYKRNRIEREITSFLKNRYGISVDELKYTKIREKLSYQIRNIWKSHGRKFDYNEVQAEVTNSILPIYDMISEIFPEYKLVCFGIEIGEYVKHIENVLMSESITLKNYKTIIESTINSLKKQSYSVILRDSTVSELIKTNIVNLIEDAWIGFLKTLVKFQTISELILRLERHFTEIHENAILFYDSESPTFSSSVYNILTETLTYQGIPKVFDDLQKIERIVAYFVQDSKKEVLLQVADLLVSGLRGSILHKDERIYQKVREHLLTNPQNSNEVWGYGLKILPWKKSSFEKYFGGPQRDF